MRQGREGSYKDVLLTTSSVWATRDESCWGILRASVEHSLRAIPTRCEGAEVFTYPLFTYHLASVILSVVLPRALVSWHFCLVLWVDGAVAIVRTPQAKSPSAGSGRSGWCL